MYKVKFYNNIIINKDYDIVFDNMLYKYTAGAISYNTVFEQYLNSNLRNTITFDNEVYMPSPSGKLELDMTKFQSVIDFNYMSIEPQYLDENNSTYADIYLHATHVDNFLSGNYNNNDYYFYNPKINQLQPYAHRQLKYYCFIDRIEHLNDVVIIYYTLDIFHTYTPFLNFFNGQLERTNVINKLIARNLSLFKINSFDLDINRLTQKRYVEYYNTNDSKFEALTNGFPSPNLYYYINIYKLSLFVLDANGNATQRQNICVCDFSTRRLKAATEDMDNLVKKSSTQTTSTNLHYSILETYVIPTYMVESFYNEAQNFISNQVITSAFSIDGVDYYSVYEVYWRTSVDESITQITVKNDLSLTQFGFYSRLVDVPYHSNTKDITVEFKIDCYMIDISLTMNYLNNTIDILDIVTIESNIDPLDASALAIAKYTREYNNKQLDLEHDKAAWNLINSVVGVGGGVAVTVATGGAGVGSIMGGVNGIVNNAMNIEKISRERDKNNAKLYTSNKANDVTQNDKLLNLLYGFILLRTDIDLNTEQYENYINDYGYTIDYKYCLTQMLRSITSAKYSFNNNGDETSTVDALTYFKYNRVDLNGNFSAEVRDGLKEIFRKGFKIVNKENKSYFDSCVSIANNKIL